MILFTGSWRVESLQRLQDSSASHSSASQPAASSRTDNEALKRKAHIAKYRYRYGKFLASRHYKNNFSDEDLRLVDLFKNGTLLEEANTLHDQDSAPTLRIGGSSGGSVRTVLDQWRAPHDTTK